MALDSEDEILQDFLVEADEILEGLNEQLVVLETQPQNSDLLNSIFRGFHTIKGGAGFLSLDAMVALCHKGEDVFNILRQGDRVVDAEMMDTFLKVLDVLNHMFVETKAGEYPSPADPAILAQLASYLSPATATPAPVIAAVIPEPVIVAPPVVTATTNEVTDNDDITDDEFEALLNQLHGDGAPGTVAIPTPAPTPIASAKSDDDITEEEFEALLDDLQGKKKAATAVQQPIIEKIVAAIGRAHV